MTSLMMVQKNDVILLETTMREHGEQLSRLKRELRAGLMTLAESVEVVKQVLEARRQLMERQLRKDMRANYDKLLDLH